MDRQDWDTRFTAELDRAEQARAAGNEGMARVCARRAAGVVAGEFLRRQGGDLPGPSAVDRMRHLASLPQVPPQVQQVAGYFLERVTPDHTLPVDVDLIAAARWLRGALLDEPLG